MSSKRTSGPRGKPTAKSRARPTGRITFEHAATRPVLGILTNDIGAYVF